MATSALLSMLLLFAVASHVSCKAVQRQKNVDVCLDRCLQRDKPFFSCNTADGWVYCLPERYFSADSDIEDDDRLRQFLQRSNFSLFDGAWYNGGVKLVLPYRISHYTTNGRACVTPCTWTGTSYTCIYGTEGYRDCCSYIKDHTCKGESCREGSVCTHDTTGSYWCYTHDSREQCGYVADEPD